MTPQSAEHFRLTVLNPAGRDPEQKFHKLPAPGEGAHPPINFHGFAACTLGAFHYNPSRAVAEHTPILLLLRSDFADGCIATTPEAAEIYKCARGKHDAATVAFIPTPYPIEDRRWNLSLPATEQSGIFVGTREWDVPSRNHFAALLVARQLCETTGEPVTLVNLDGYKARRLLDELKFPEGKICAMWRSIRSFWNSTEAMCQARLQATLSSPGSSASEATALSNELRFRKLAAKAAQLTKSLQ